MRWRKTEASNFQDDDRVSADADATSAEFTVSEDGEYAVELLVRGASSVIGRGGTEMQVYAYRPGHLLIDYAPFCHANKIIGIQADPVNNGVEVRWTNPNDAAITKYQYHFQQGVALHWDRIAWTDAAGTDASTTSFTVPGLENGETYGVVLRAVAGSKTYCFDSLMWVTPSDPTIKNPLNLHQPLPVPGDNQSLTLSWDDPGDDTLSHEYEFVLLGTFYHDSQSWTAIDAEAVTSANGKLYATLFKLPCPGTFYFRMRARRGDAIGPLSTQRSAFLGRFLPQGVDTYTVPDGEDDCVFGGSGNDRLTGAEGDDRLYGGFGDDTLTGNAGNDTLRGHYGNDTLYGNAGDDVLTGWRHRDTLYGGEGSDWMSGGAHNDLMLGGNGNDELYGDTGNDTLHGGAGADTINGSTGNDTASYEGSDAAITVNLSTNSMSGGHATGDTLTSVENITGSRHNDTLTGDGNANVLIGASGDDALTGGAGNDQLNGGAGADTIDGGAGNDTATYEGSDAAITVNLSTNSMSGGHATGDTLTSVENITGSRHNDTLTGDGNANVLIGASGDDALTGGAGNDQLNGGAGADTIDGGAGKDTVSYSGASAAVVADLATSGNNQGEAVGDTFSSMENITGSSHNDILGGDGSANVLSGGDGDDTLWGHDGDDELYGGNGRDILLGGDGSDTLQGGNGNDFLTGQAGDDTLTGGDGSDAFYFQVSFGNDDVEDYVLGASQAASEKIHLCMGTAAPFATHSGADSGSDHIITVTFNGATQGTITLKGITTGSANFANLNVIAEAVNSAACQGG